MLLNASKAEAASTGFQAVYDTELHKQEAWAPQVALMLRTEKTAETFPWAEILGGYKRWIGPVLKNNVAIEDVSAKPEDWRFDIVVPKKAVDDDSIGIFSQQFAQMGIEAGNLDNQIVAEALLAGYSATGVCGACYDGGAFFAANHPDAAGHSQDNTGTGALTAITLEAALKKMRSLVTAGGSPIPFALTHIIAGVGSIAAAEDLRDLEIVGGTSNKWRGRFQVIFSPHITGNDWFLLDLSKGTKPMFVLTRQDPDFNKKIDPTLDCVSERNEYEYYSYARKCVRFLFWQMIYASTGD